MMSTSTRMAQGRRPFLVVLLPAMALLSASSQAADAPRALSFEDRVAAQAAIERVYYFHQIGASKPFDEAVPRAVIERKVRAYLDQSSEMERSLGMPLTSEALAAEAARIAHDTRMPERLAELHAALGNDPLLIQEALARPSLLKRRAQDGARPGPAALTAGSCTAGNGWTSTLLSQPGPAGNAQVVWTGSLLFSYGGHSSLGGAVYDPVLDTWTPISVAGSPACAAAPIWTGHEVIVWCPVYASRHAGGRYDPVSDSWRSIAEFNYYQREGHSLVWAGDRLIVYGGWCTDVLCGGAESFELGDGYEYLVEEDVWLPLSFAGSPPSVGRAQPAAVWTGTRMMVWGGIKIDPWPFGLPPRPYWIGTFGDGALYDPVGRTWEPISNSSAPASRSRHTVLWTGTEVLVWGGQTVITNVDDFGDLHTDYSFNPGGRYDPATNTWTPITSVGAPTDRQGAGAVWTGQEAIVWGGSADPGAMYVPSTDSWYPISLANAPTDKSSSAVAWDGQAMLVYGGATAARGGRYLPGDVAGLADADQDGFTTCAGDCDDTVSSAYPGAAEACDSIDNDCDGKVDEGGQPDADADGYAAGCGDCNDGNPTIYAGAQQVCDDGLNNDCLHPSWPSLTGTNERDDDADSYSECQSDCNDARSAIHPGAAETCDSLDNNCNGSVDEGADGDQDGHSILCDCNDASPVVYPGAPQVCDGVNNNCLAFYYPALDFTNEADRDGDGYSECQGDCDANDPSSYPGAPEVCDGSDNNCDGLVDEGTDVDGDGQTPCGGDCLPGNPAVYSGAPQVCDGVNNDCASPGWPSLAQTNEGDHDGDGYSVCQQDCNDANGQIWVFPTEPRDLVLSHNVSTGQTALAWTSTIQQGESSVVYDVLRSTRKDSFVSSTLCVESNGGDFGATDPLAPPQAGTGFFYLIRGENSCPAVSRAGSNSSGVPIPARNCP